MCCLVSKEKESFIYRPSYCNGYPRGGDFAEDPEIERACETLLATAALDEITLRQVRVTLEQQFGTSISREGDRRPHDDSQRCPFRVKVIEVIGVLMMISQRCQGVACAISGHS